MRKEVEMMRVLRIPPLGKLVVEVSGQRFEMLSEINHAKVEQRLLAAIGELVVFAGGYQALVDAGAAPAMAAPVAARPVVVETAVPPSPEPPAEQPPLSAEQARFLAELEAQRDALKNQSSARQPSVLRPVPPSIPPAAPVPQVNLVAQIDEILQKHLAAEPEMAARRVHLRENPSGGLRIEVDGRFYDRPREVPDPNIQHIIKKALKDWETA